MRNSQPRTTKDCDRYVTMLLNYIEGKLSHAEKMFLEAHLSVCDACSGKLDDLIEAELDSQENRFAKAPFYPPIGLYDSYQEMKKSKGDLVGLQISDKVIEFPRLRVVGEMERSENEILRKAAQSRDEKTSEYGDTQLLSDNRGIIYTDMLSGHFCVQLIGPPEKTAGIRLALCEEKPDGSWKICVEEKTDKLGIADFGRIDDIPKPQFEQEYTLCIESVADSEPED